MLLVMHHSHLAPWMLPLRLQFLNQRFSLAEDFDFADGTTADFGATGGR